MIMQGWKCYPKMMIQFPCLLNEIQLMALSFGVLIILGGGLRYLYFMVLVFCLRDRRGLGQHQFFCTMNWHHH
jgi:hypothetical protein